MAQTQTTTNAKRSTAKQLNGHAPHAQQKLHADHTQTASERMFKRLHDAREEAMSFFKVPSWKRALIAFVAGVTAGGVAGSVMLTLTDWLIVGAISAGAGLFVQMVLAVIGLALTMYAAWKISARVTGAVLTGEADERAIAAYDATRAMLSRINPLRVFRKDELAAA